MGIGNARGVRLSCKEEKNQMGSNPIISTKEKIRVDSKEDVTVVKSPACAKADSTDENFTIVK